MNAKETAKDLINKMLYCYQGHIDEYTAKQCALICVDKIIKELEDDSLEHTRILYYKEVRQEVIAANNKIEEIGNTYYYHSECGSGKLIREYNHPTLGDMMVVIAEKNGKEYFAPKKEFKEMPF